MYRGAPRRRRATTPIDRAQVEYLLGQLAANKASNDIVETGIKVIDVMCPIRAGGSVAIATEYGAGMTVVLEEIVRRISKGPHPVTMLALFPPPSEIWPPSLDENYSIAEGLAKDGYSDGNVGSVQTFFVGGEPQPWTDEKLAKFASVDTLIHLTRDMIVRKTYPGVELRTTRSRLLDDALIDADDVNLARRIRELITASRAAETDSASALDPVLTERTAKLQAYFSQPFFVAEPYTKRPGSVVARASALRTCREILDGLHDDLTADDFYFTGDIEEIRQAAGRS
jgi:F-type H+/Na+-transporting ATPase subunit beta